MKTIPWKLFVLAGLCMACAACDEPPLSGVIFYTITYDANGGTGTLPQARLVPGGTGVTLPGGSGLSKNGYTFDGWYLISNPTAGRLYAAGDFYTPSGNVTFYAEWTANTYTVTLDGNGGGAPTPAAKTVTYGAAYGPLPAMNRTGYRFMGWYTAISGGTLVTAATTVTMAAHHTLYAHWIAFTPAQSREMASILDLTITGSGSDGAFPSGRTVTLSAYNIAKYETTYQLWYEVKTWAASNGYTFSNYHSGREGDSGTNGAAPTEAATTMPVTGVSWRDVVVWCNAYSEMSGKTPAYYRDSSCVTVITSLSDDTVYMKSGANGYRLPTDAEWEAAARGGDPSAAAWSYTYAGSDTIDDVAWYNSPQNSNTQPVGGKTANSAGLYDMSGNVSEWCYDWYDNSVGTGTVVNPTGPASGKNGNRMIRGGDYRNPASICTVTVRYYGSAAVEYSNAGFRVVCAP